MDLIDIGKLREVQSDGRSFTQLSRRIRVNPLISEYYERLGAENPDIVYRYNDCGGSWDYNDWTDTMMDKAMRKRAERVLSCGRSIETKVYKESKAHYIRQVVRCRDKFCGNCQKQLANARERKYTPLLNEISKYYDLYHITFTVPNVPGVLLSSTVDKIFKAFSKFTKIISGKKKIHGYDFGYLGYQGCLRSLEITMNMEKTNYHPHLHCIFVFSKGLNLDQPKTETNDFSYSYGRKVRQFSSFEILVQRLWYLCYGRKVVTAKAIEVSPGYSCIVNAADGQFHQIFKYAIKGLLDDQKAAYRHGDGSGEQRGITYEIFEDLFFALEKRRTVQGYGCFYALKLDESLLENEEETDRQVQEILKKLSEVEDGRLSTERLADVIRNILNGEIYFSSADIKKDLDSLKETDENDKY